MLSGNPAVAYQAPGLARVAPAKSQAQPTQPDEDFNPIHEIVKQVGFGNLTNDPNKLNAIRAAAQCTGREPEPYHAAKTGPRIAGKRLQKRTDAYYGK